MSRTVCCIDCMKDISIDDVYCPYCGFQQCLDLDDTPIHIRRPKREKRQKAEPLYSAAEVATAILKRDDKDYIDYLFTRLL